MSPFGGPTQYAKGTVESGPVHQLSIKRHLKCDNDKPVCKRCERNGEECVRGGSKIRFRHGSSARYDSEFSRDQTWIRTSTKNKTLEYIDETAGVASSYAQESQSDTASNPDPQETDQNLHIRTSSFPSSRSDHGARSLVLDTRRMGPSSPSPTIPRSGDIHPPPLKRRKTNESLPPTPTRPHSSHPIGSPDSHFSFPSQSPNISYSSHHSPPQPPDPLLSAQERESSIDYAALLTSAGLVGHHEATDTLDDTFDPPATSNNAGKNLGIEGPSPGTRQLELLSPRFWNQQSVWPHASIQEACLMRYFVENLAHWFDLCDPERHFALVVPQRARSCPPLLNAIFTASARHLSRVEKYRTSAGIQYQDKVLPDLKIETAIRYHNECIQHLIQLSHLPEQVHDENLLAAATILRFYEEVDNPLQGGNDNELFLHMINIFIDAQIPSVSVALPHSSPLISFSVSQTLSNGAQNHTSPSSSGTVTTSSGRHERAPAISRQNGLRQAAFWVAFRQEIYTAFMTQRPFEIPLERCASFRTYEPAEDAVWADRLVVFCADVLHYCNGSEKKTKERWDELKATEQQWLEVLPTSFEPIYYREPDPNQGEIFPEIWYLADCHVAGVQHVELARIMLSVHNPNIPRLGPGHLQAARKLSADLKLIVLRLCGIALSNRKTPPGLVTACMGIAMCGEHFEERSDQEALLSLLSELEVDHAWPTERTANSLRESWGWV